jgi:tryptophan synthase beta chain
MQCTVFMVRCSYDQKPGRRTMMELSGARVIPSPSSATAAGQAVLAEHPDSPGSLSIAGSEAIQYAQQADKCRYSSGSAENHVLLHQTVIGLEAVVQLRQLGEVPDVVVGAIGAGSNFGGLAFPFYREAAAHDRAVDLVAVEPTACPTLTRGVYTWDYHDALGTMPMSQMYTLGHRFVPSAIHAGGLRYHGASPTVSWMYKHDLVKAVAYGQRSVFEAGVTFAQTEQVIPAPESAHAIRHVINEAIQARDTGADKVILFCLSGHGLLDLAAYEEYLTGSMMDADEPDAAIADSLRTLAALPL